jgi:Lon protease-like protein
MNNRVLPIFTLNTVIFPGATLPLRIFEDRYKKMFNDSISKDSIFGVNLIKQGYEVGVPAVPYDVGTIVSFADHSVSVSNEEIFLKVIGQKRFKIAKILNDRPYILAEITDYSDLSKKIIHDQKFEQNFRNEAAEFVKKIVSINGGWLRDPHFPEDFNEFVWTLASLLQMLNHTKLEVLETTDLYHRAQILLDQLKIQTVEIQNVLEGIRDQNRN